jgi:hypothetical protein
MLLEAHADPVTVWTIYCHPSDYPGCWVLRAHEVFPGKRMRPNSFCFVAATLGELRSKVPPGTCCVGRATEDDPRIYECWIAVEPMLRRH